jgi:hypothetical protein
VLGVPVCPTPPRRQPALRHVGCVRKQQPCHGSGDRSRGLAMPGHTAEGTLAACLCEHQAELGCVAGRDGGREPGRRGVARKTSCWLEMCQGRTGLALPARGARRTRGARPPRGRRRTRGRTPNSRPCRRTAAGRSFIRRRRRRNTRSTPDLDAKVAALVDKLRTDSESVWSWRQAEDGTVDVLLIEADKIPQARRMLAIGLAGGEGRSLQFRQVDGRWALAGQARWIG